MLLRYELRRLSVTNLVYLLSMKVKISLSKDGIQCNSSTVKGTSQRVSREGLETSTDRTAKKHQTLDCGGAKKCQKKKC